MRARLAADHYQDGRGVDLFTLAGPDVLQRQGLQAGLAVHVSVDPLRSTDYRAGLIGLAGW